MVAPSQTCRKAMPEVRARDPRWSRLRNHVECQMSCSGSRQRLPNYGTSAIITDHPRLLPIGRVTQLGVNADLFQLGGDACVEGLP